MRKDLSDTQGNCEPSDDGAPHGTGRNGEPREDWGSSESFQHGYDSERPHFRRDR